MWDSKFDQFQLRPDLDPFVPSQSSLNFSSQVYYPMAFGHLFPWVSLAMIHKHLLQAVPIPSSGPLVKLIIKFKKIA